MMKLPATESTSSESGLQYDDSFRGHVPEGNGRPPPQNVQNNEMNVINNFRGERPPAPAGFPSPGEPDFSEFLWMEHEDEYDQEVGMPSTLDNTVHFVFFNRSYRCVFIIFKVMRELEEEEMINYYFDLYQDSLQAEANGQEYPLAHILGSAGSSTNHQGTGNNAAVGAGEDLSSRFNSVLNFQSTLNPNAAEFVPRTLGGESEEKQPTL